MANGRVYYVLVPEESSLGKSTGPMCLWFAEDRGQWVLTDPTRLGDSREVLARIAARGWWPWELHLGGNTSPASMGSAPFACLPEWHGGGAILASARPGWEVADPAPARGTFHKSKTMRVDLLAPKVLRVKGAKGASHPFLGTYELKDVLSARPFYMQSVAKVEADPNIMQLSDMPVVPPKCYVLWYAEDLDQWVITEDFRLLDYTTVNARVADNAWFPSEAERRWEVPDGSGDFCVDPSLVVERMQEH